jgi:hypothetical protein
MLQPFSLQVMSRDSKHPQLYRTNMDVYTYAYAFCMVINRHQDFYDTPDWP